MSVSARSGVGLARAVYPGEAFAYRSVEHIVRAVVDGQVKSYNRVAISGVRQRDSWSSRTFCIGAIVYPGKVLASHLLIDTRSGLIDSQVESYDRVAAIGGTTDDGKGRSCRANGIYAIINPSEGLASHLFIDAGSGMVDGQVEGYDRVAAICGTAGNGIGRGCGAFSIGTIVNPCEGLASHLFIDAHGGMIDSQVESDNRVTSCFVRQREGWSCRTFGIGAIVNPGEAFAGNLLIDAVGTLTHCHKPSDNTVAAFGSLQGLGVNASFGQWLTIEVKSITLAKHYTDIGSLSNVLLDFPQPEAFLIIQATVICGSHTHIIL